MRTFRKYAPWLLLGPITGFLMAGIYYNSRRHEPLLASLYGFALLVTWVDFAAYSGQAVKILHGLV